MNKIMKFRVLFLLNICFHLHLGTSDLKVLSDIPDVDKERVLYGFESYRGQFPFVVRLVQEYPKKFHTSCGGSVISDRWILTAAHCATGAESAYILFGQMDVTNMSKVFFYNINSTSMVIHPDYVIQHAVNDIALYQTPSSIPFSRYSWISTINLPKRSQSALTFDNVVGTLVGYGTYNNTNAPINQLYAPVHVLSHAECAAFFTNKYGMNNTILDWRICTDKTINHGACPGDSGGPLTVNGTDGNPVVIGIASFIVETCESPYPVVYTYPGYYLNWINQVTGIPIVD